MDDGINEYRRNKPQQQIYRPGSGPLRKSFGSDARMNSYDGVSGSRGRDRSLYGSKNSIYEEDSFGNKDHSTPNSRHKKPDQQHYIARSGDNKQEDNKYADSSVRSDSSSQSYSRRREKHGYNSNSHHRGGRRDHKDGSHGDNNYNRNFRQVSEPRSTSPSQMRDSSGTDRNRDTRSMETSGRHMPMGGKPPSGRRNSAGYSTEGPRPKYTLNLDNLPPRLRKKFLEQSGQHVDNAEQMNRDKYPSNHSPQSNMGYVQTSAINNTATWSQTLPSRGRGRLRDNDFDREKFLNSYLRNNEVQNSRRSTPSNSYMNLYEPTSVDMKNHQLNENEAYSADNNKENYDSVSKNGVSNDVKKDNNHEQDSKHESDSEGMSLGSMNFADMANLDWTEEVEKNCDSTTSSPSFGMKSISITQDIKPIERKVNETRESKRKSRRRDKRSSSRGQNNEKKSDRIRRDSGHQDLPPPNLQRDRERRDSHRSNRSSTIGNSRDDLDRWRSLGSFGGEHSTEGRIVSQCNSRDVSANRDNDGFRIPAGVPRGSNWSHNNQQKKNNGSWASGRTGSIERTAQSPVRIPEPTPPAETVGSTKSKRRSGRRRTRNSENNASAAQPQPTSNRNQHATSSTNWREEIIESKKHSVQDRLDRHKVQDNNRNRLNSCHSDKSESSTHHPGLLILPQSSMTQMQKENPREGSSETQKTLFDHHNPSKPIVVQANPAKIDLRLDRGTDSWARMCGAAVQDMPDGNEAQRAARHRPLLQEVDRADAILQTHTLRGPLGLADHWADVGETRKFLLNALQKLLLSDLKYCQSDNIEHHFWKILYYNFIEVLRKSLTQVTPEDKQRIVKLINTIIEEGNAFFENLVKLLEQTYKFNTEDFINENHTVPPKGLGYVGLALISVQKLYVFLGDLARYKEQVNETNNYAKSKFWYTKAQQVNPKNGRPYNQLAILAIYARRKLDAVYYYMRSLMSSNAFHSARESLISLFDENRKKYEAAERKRRAVIDNANGNSETDDSKAVKGGLRKEIWVRPSGGKTTMRPEVRDDGLSKMTPVELNKNFITSYLHVHGKLVTKIGMETFHECAGLMLRQFRALLHQQPLPIPSARLLQLTALNMFSVECTANAKKDVESRSSWLDCALGVSFLMFGALLERCCALLPEPAHTQQHADALLLLPAIKAWSDWMLCHSSEWNPPPSLDSYDIGSENDPWDWLAKLMNILESLDDKSIGFETEMKEGYESVRLSEDATLAGFTPLMYMEPTSAYVKRSAPLPLHLAEHALRMRKLLFFGTEYLVGVEPPVLKLEYPSDASPRYVSAVQRARTPRTSLRHLSEDSEEDEDQSVSERDANAANGTAAGADGVEVTDEATRKLLRRKEQLEAKRANIERRKQRMQELLRSGGVSVEVEVRPRWLVPDTNCFIEHLGLLQQCVLAKDQPCLLAVPLVVVTELEGLQKCSRVGPAASEALNWLSSPSVVTSNGVRYATSRGTLLTSRVFTAEQEQPRATNDDRVLATALNMHANIASEPDVAAETQGGAVRCVRRIREVVLLTDDRNLRVKALAAELPVRDLPSFVQWAGFSDAAKSAPPPPPPAAAAPPEACR